jgi:uncharacterized protein YecT (DUF1311 family)
LSALARRITISALLLAMPPAPPALAEMYDTEFRSCSDGSTAAIVQCLASKTRAWDARLNAGFRTAMQSLEPPQREALRQAQRLWVQYRDANCRSYGLGEGSISRIAAAECVRSMTAERARELEAVGKG